QLAERDGGANLLFQNSRHHRRGLHTALVNVGVRVNVEGDDRVRVLDHCPRDVGVQVDRHHNGQFRSDDLADCQHQIALGVFKFLGGHRPVQVEVDPVAGPSRLKPLEHQTFDVLVGALFDRPAGDGKGPDQRIDGEVVARAFVYKSTVAGARTAEVFD